MENASKYGIQVLKKYKPTSNKAVMFDIDDTLIYYNGKPNKDIIKLSQISNAIGFKNIIITARPNFVENRLWTENQLKENCIPFDLIVYTSHQNKSQVKQKMQKDFILSVGDMWTDLTDTKHWIKLPCSDNKNILTDITNV